MTAILFIIGLVVLVICRHDWKKCLYLLIIVFPFLGYIQLNILHLTQVAPIIQDITIILPMYLLFIAEKIGEKNKKHYLPDRVKNILIFFVLYIFIFAINPFFEVNFLVRMIGAKVWLFYLLFILIGFEFVESELDLKKFCSVFAIVAIIPCLIGILLYLGSYFIDYKLTMTTFFGGNYSLAGMSTQGFANFDWGGGVFLFRNPSTFSFATQFNQYATFSLIPAIAALGFSKTAKEKFFYFMIIIVIILGTFSSGQRGNLLYLSLFFIFLILIQTRFYISLALVIPIFIILSLTNLESLHPILQTVFRNVSDLTVYYGGGYVFEELSYIVTHHFLGNGVGSYTFEARYALGSAQEMSASGFVPQVGRVIHEGYYHKVLLELGVSGLLMILVFFMIILSEIILSIRKLQNRETALFCSLVLAFFLLMLVGGTKATAIFRYPANFIFFLFFGMAIKLRFLKLDHEK